MSDGTVIRTTFTDHSTQCVREQFLITMESINSSPINWMKFPIQTRHLKIPFTLAEKKQGYYRVFNQLGGKASGATNVIKPL